jgi:hypothetical protein
LPELQARSRARVARNAYFKKLGVTLRKREARRENGRMPLALDAYFAERERHRVEGDSLEALQKLATGLTAAPLASQNAAVAADSLEREKVREWKDQLAKDFLLREAVDVLGDWIAAQK